MSRDWLAGIIALLIIGFFIVLIMMILLMDLGKIESELAAFLVGMWERDIVLICSYYFGEKND